MQCRGCVALAAHSLRALPLSPLSLRVQAGSNGEEQVVSFDSNRELSLGDYPRPFNLLNSQRLVYEAVEVNRCVRAKLQQSSAWSHAQTMQVMRIMDEVRKQIRQ